MVERVPRFSRRWMPLVLLALLIGAPLSWSLVIDGVRAIREPPTIPMRRAALPPPAAPAKPHRATADAPADAAPPAASAKPADTPTTRDVRIVVVAEDGAPIAGAAVHIDEIETFEDASVGAVDATTGADGVALVKIERGPSAFLRVGKRGYCVRRETIERDAAEVGMTLAAGIPLAGRIVLADSREPVEGVAVRAWDSGKLNGDNDKAELDAPRVTGADGRFELAGVPAGRQITIVAAKAGFRSQSLVTTVSAPGPEVEMLLGDGGVMFGTVYGEDGRPLPGVEVLQMPPDTELPDRAEPGLHETYARAAYMTFLFPPVETDAGGRYEFRGVRLPMNGVPQPRLAVARKADGHTARGEPATFAKQGERQQRDVRFAKAPTITVRLKSASPLPEGTKLRAQRSGGGMDVETDIPQDGAPATFPDLTPGLYFVSVSTGDGIDGQWRVSRQVTVAGGDAAAVEFVIDDTARIAGRVVDTDGHGIAGMSVSFDASLQSQEEYVSTTVLSAADGSFVLERLLALRGLVRAGPGAERTFFGRVPAEAVGFESVELPDVRPGAGPLTITLRRLGKLDGRISPVPAEREQSLRAISGRREGYGRLRIRDDGRFECDAPLVGVAMRVWMENKGGAPVVLDVAAVGSGETRDLGEIALTPGLVLDGKLVDADGKPIANAEVGTLERWMGIQRPTTGADGRFRIERIPKRPLVLRVGATATTPVTILVVADPSVSPATFPIAPGALMSGHVLGADGNPVPNAHVTFFPGADLTDAEDAFGWTEADAAGRFTFRLQAGHGRVNGYDMKRHADGEKVDLTVTDGETRTLDLRVDGR